MQLKCELCGIEMEGEISKSFAGIILCHKCWDMVSFKNVIFEDDYNFD